MPYSEIYYHVVWATKGRAPSITPDIEGEIYSYIAKKVHGLGGYLHSINGISDHIHIIVSIPVNISISSFIGQIKGIASTKINKSCLQLGEFRWQSGYSIISLGKKELKYHIRYVENQKHHHADKTTQNKLENTKMSPS